MPPALRRDTGESLVEILAAVTILSIGVTALVTALGTHATVTRVNRSQSQASTSLQAAAELVKSLPLADSPPDGRIDSCAGLTDADVTMAELAHDPLYKISYAPVACSAGARSVVVRVVVSTTDADGFTADLDVVKRP
jgi:Tfp pilus assembly protein PilV